MTAAGWTRCADALPPCPSPEIWDWCAESPRVLIFSRWGAQNIATLRTFNDDEPSDAEPRRDWCLVGRDGYTYDLADVTHWHPLPENPQP